MGAALRRHNKLPDPMSLPSFLCPEMFPEVGAGGGINLKKSKEQCMTGLRRKNENGKTDVIIL